MDISYYRHNEIVDLSFFFNVSYTNTLINKLKVIISSLKDSREDESEYGNSKE